MPTEAQRQVRDMVRRPRLRAERRTFGKSIIEHQAIAFRLADMATQLQAAELNDFPVERFYRDVRVCSIYEGMSDIQRLVIARELTA